MNPMTYLTGERKPRTRVLLPVQRSTGSGANSALKLPSINDNSVETASTAKQR
jgi:hypothetical protein